MSISQQTLNQFAQSPDYQKAQDDIRQLLSRSASDMEFRQQLLSDPRAALQAEGHSVPEGVDIRFIENEHDATIVLPDVVDMEAELSESELETVAGGSTTLCYLIISYLTGR